MADRSEIRGTTIFDGDMAQRGYALNRMCFALNSAAERKAFLANEAAFLDRFDLTSGQRRAVEERNVLALLAAGGNIYYLAKLAGTLGLNMQDIGAQQTGTSVDEFSERLLAAGRD